MAGPNPSRSSLGAGWETAGRRGRDASDRSWLMEGVSPSVVLVPAQFKSRRLAANACWAACVRMADQCERREVSTALRRMLGTAVACVWGRRRRKVVATEEFWVCALLGFARVLERCSCVLAGTSSGLAG